MRRQNIRASRLALVMALSLARLLHAAPPEVAGSRIETVAAAEGLAAAFDAALARSTRPLWLGWAQPGTAGREFTCCFTSRFRPDACRLDSTSGQSWGSSSSWRRESGARVTVLLRLEGGRVTRVLPVSEGCSLDAGAVPFRWLEGVAPEESLSLLERLAAEAAGEEDAAEEAVAALSLHAGPEADRSLERLAAPGRSRELREAAIFWLGQHRGRPGLAILARMARADADPDIREHAVFSLSQMELPEAIEAILAVARGDASPDVRGQALFWLAQTGDAGAAQAILAALAADPSEEVRERGVFALSQLPDHAGTVHLVRLVRESRDAEVRRQALFWLGQSDDPRAMDLLEELLAD